MKTNKLFSIHIFSWLLVLCVVSFSKVLIVADQNYYLNSGKSRIDRYLWDVNHIDHTLATLVLWDWKSWESNDARYHCFPLWQRLQQEYVASRNLPPSEQLTGAVFIGDLPIPKFYHGQLLIDTIINGDTLWKNIYFGRLKYKLIIAIVYSHLLYFIT